MQLMKLKSVRLEVIEFYRSNQGNTVEYGVSFSPLSYEFFFNAPILLCYLYYKVHLGKYFSSEIIFFMSSKREYNAKIVHIFFSPKCAFWVV